MARIRTPGDGPKCVVCGKPAVWSGYCKMEDGKGYCDSPPSTAGSSGPPGAEGPPGIPPRADILLSSTTHILSLPGYRGGQAVVTTKLDRIHPGDFLIIQTEVGSYHRVAGDVNNRYGDNQDQAYIPLRG